MAGQDKAGSGSVRMVEVASAGHLSGNSEDPVGSRTAKEAPQPVTDLLQPGTIWKGSWTFQGAFAKGQTWPFEFAVSERIGAKLKAEAHLTDPSGRLIREGIEGRVEGGRIEFELTGLKLSRSKMRGNIEANSIRFDFEGITAGGEAGKKFGHGNVKIK